MAGELPVGIAVAHAVMEQAEVASVWGIYTVPDPIGLNKYHHIYDGETNREYRPEYSDGPGVSHVVVMVDLGGFLRWQHFFLNSPIFSRRSPLYCPYTFYNELTKTRLR